MLITLENIFNAWDEFKKGKRNKLDVMQFERHLEDNLFNLYADFSNKTYCHQPYETFHVYDPKFRVINKATVRDRVVHHLVFNHLESIFQLRFIRQSYSCQKEKGIHLALEDVTKALRRASSNYRRTVWVLKLDIRKFFDSIDHEILLRLLNKRVDDMEVVWLLERIVKSFCSPMGKGRGVPIGNLTSQIFANIYLSELDYYVKFVLLERYYFRYADDFLIISEERLHLEILLFKLQQFLEEQLNLRLHPHKIILRKFQQGIDFVGYVMRPHSRVLRTRTKQRMFRRMVSQSFNQQRLQSYLGLLSHCSGYRLGQELRNKVWTDSCSSLLAL